MEVIRNDYAKREASRAQINHQEQERCPRERAKCNALHTACSTTLKTYEEREKQAKKHCDARVAEVQAVCSSNGKELTSQLQSAIAKVAEVLQCEEAKRAMAKRYATLLDLTKGDCVLPSKPEAVPPPVSPSALWK